MVLYLLDMVGHVLLLTVFYMVLPVGQIRFGHALIGGVTATLLWELTRHVLVWYFARLSMTNLIYGSMEAVIVVLLTLEAAAVILLLGAQVIAEIDRDRGPSRKGAGAASHRRRSSQTRSRDGADNSHRAHSRAQSVSGGGASSIRRSS